MTTRNILSSTSPNWAPAFAGEAKTARQEWATALALTLLLAALALLRPVDHDESQYVAAAALTAHGLLPYRDFAYLQTPLQPFAFAPVAWIGGAWTWPALRLVNAALGTATILLVHRAARLAGAAPRAAFVAAGLFASCDILLFSIGTARNDALPAALLAGALVCIVRRQTRTTALLAGLLLAGAAAAKISYALPALAYGAYALWHRRHPTCVALGTLPILAFVAWTYALSPEGFVFGTLTFPARAPAEYYALRPWKLSLAAKAVDTLKFLALGAALPALILVCRDACARSPRHCEERSDAAIQSPARRPGLLRFARNDDRPLDWLIVAGLIAALLPWPTWRQYLLPALVPLFVRLALIEPPTRGWRVALAIFATAGLAPTAAALFATGGLPLAQAMRESDAVGRTLDAEHVTGPIATLSPQFLPATGRLPDARFATGPFYYRSTALLDAAAERRLHLMSKARPQPLGVVLIGGEGPATSGDARLDAALGAGRSTPIPGTRFRLVRP